MDKQERRYWAIRTDRENKSLLLGELRAGRLRQGWGYDASQNLQAIQAEITKGGTWWERLSSLQKEAFPHLRMLSAAEDSIHLGDLIVLPNLPEDGNFLIAEVSGPYWYDPLKLSKEHDINELGQDYGHILPVRLVTERGINKFANHVDATLRSTLRTRSRMWNLDGYSDAIERLIEEYKRGADFSVAKSGQARLETAWEKARLHALDSLRERLGPELDARFQAAEWEEPIVQALKNLYPGTDVQWVAGPKEYGADVIVQIPNNFGNLPPWLIVIQVKNFIGEINAAVLAQLRTAYDRYSKQGKILSLIAMTTAERESAELTEARQALSEELQLPVEVVLRKDMIKLLSEGFMPNMP